jgi:hypothetical protein
MFAAGGGAYVGTGAGGTPSAQPGAGGVQQTGEELTTAGADRWNG